MGAELEEAIEEPTKLQGYSFEKGLLGEILPDVGQEKECLPLLQFALMELWEKRDQKKHQLTVEQYRALGGVAGALNDHAEKIYTYKDFLKESPQQERSPQEQEWIKRIFLRLVRTSEGVKDIRQRQPKTKLLEIAENNEADRKALNDILDELVQGRLLVTGQKQQEEAWVDLTHEALIGGWKQFADWCEESRELRRLIDRVEDAQREWQKEPHDKNLMMGGLLDQVGEQWEELKINLAPAAREFYQRSDAYEQERKQEISLLKKQLQEMQQVISNLFQELAISKHGNFLSQLQALQSQLNQEEQEIEEFALETGARESNFAALTVKIADYRETLQRLEQRMQSSKRAVDWLDEQRNTLIEDAVNYVLNREDNLNKFNVDADSNKKNEQFYRDIKNYMKWIVHSLKLGEPIPLNKINIKPALPRNAYKTAFNFIKRERVSNQLSDRVAEELEAYLDYLLDYFSSPSH